MPSSIAIVGAGLGGLVLARILHLRGVSATVYEAEPGPHDRGQGGLLDIHADTGQVALRAAGLADSFQDLVRPGEDAKRVVDRHGTVLLDRPGSDLGARPEVDRGELRTLLLHSLPAGAVRWDHKLVGVSPIADGRHRLTFARADSVYAELVVGADGAWSKVRQRLSGIEPAYTGTCFIEIRIGAGTPSAAACAEVIGGGTLMAVAPGRGILMHHNHDGSLSGYVVVRRPLDQLASIDGDSLAAEFEGWSPELTALFAGSCAERVLRPIHMLPVGHSWDRLPGVTLLGDAAHLMSPFAGLGANLAMYDAAELAAALTAPGADVAGALADYERDLFPRSTELAQQSAHNLDQFFGRDAPRSVVELFDRRRG